MQPTKEKIIETIQEVMSQGQFQFEDSYNKGISIPLPLGFGYFFLILILCAFIIFFIVLIKDSFKGPEEKKQMQPVKICKEKKSLPLPSNPIEKLRVEILNSLQTRNVITIQKWKTNSDYILEGKNPLFQKVCVLYDAAVYGAKEIPIESVSLLDEEFKIWRRQK